MLGNALFNKSLKQTIQLLILLHSRPISGQFYNAILSISLELSVNSTDIGLCIFNIGRVAPTLPISAFVVSKSVELTTLPISETPTLPIQAMYFPNRGAIIFF